MKVRRVLVAQAYFLRFDPKLLDAAEPSPPLGSLIFAAVLRDRGFDVRFFDSMLKNSEDECGAAMDRERPDALVLFEDNFNYLTKMCLDRMRDAAVRMIDLAKARGIDVIVAGSDASDDPAFFLRAGATAGAIGEGEITVLEWLESTRDAAAHVPGIAMLSMEGEVRRAAPRPPIRDLDSMPSPAWDLIDLDAYCRVWATKGRSLSLPLVREAHMGAAVQRALGGARGGRSADSEEAGREQGACPR